MGKNSLNDNDSFCNSIFVYKCNNLLKCLIQDFIKSAWPGYVGSFNTELEFAIEYFDTKYLDWLMDGPWELPGHIKEVISEYIDYESFCKNIFENEFFSLEIDGETHVFKRVG